MRPALGLGAGACAPKRGVGLRAVSVAILDAIWLTAGAAAGARDETSSSTPREAPICVSAVSTPLRRTPNTGTALFFT
eukprot:CAMPEP_0174701328 /NCGR_PEP_ID=MMETSP1094-20130205/5998_1 /TAXON_ID=156173 /ORGANISM="Chrysochromulina brevifilum, Strain UTEX LB 985" /LENGTH=77 /DNA_ID=CAMNT_0015898945 /DNA_START=39 /DNA_END=267 /DNA_ORIENTATION=-